MHGRTRLLAYAIDDNETLRDAGCPDGLILYAFIEGRSVGYWSLTCDPGDLGRVMEAYRDAVQSGRSVPPQQMTIHPTYNRSIERAIESRIGHLDVSHLLAEEPEHGAEVIDFPERRP